jgi:hypothetical protein
LKSHSTCESIINNNHILTTHTLSLLEIVDTRVSSALETLIVLIILIQ